MHQYLQKIVLYVSYPREAVLATLQLPQSPNYVICEGVTKQLHSSKIKDSDTFNKIWFILFSASFNIHEIYFNINKYWGIQRLVNLLFFLFLGCGWRYFPSQCVHMFEFQTSLWFTFSTEDSSQNKGSFSWLTKTCTRKNRIRNSVLIGRWDGRIVQK